MHPGTTHQAQEKRFHLIILVVTDEQPTALLQRAFKHSVASLARGRLDALSAANDRYALHLTWHMQFFANCQAMRFPDIGLGRKTMVNVQREQRRRDIDGCDITAEGDQ